VAPEAEKPLKVLETSEFVPHRRERMMGNKNIIGGNRRRLCRQAVTSVDNELLGHLLRKFAFIPRTADLMVVMSRTAQAYYKGFDCSDLTELELYKVTVKTITAAMDVPEEEEECRQHLKSRELGEARDAHVKMMKGNLGTVKNIFGMSRKAELPGRAAS
jgi:hypothetical protein